VYLITCCSSCLAFGPCFAVLDNFHLSRNLAKPNKSLWARLSQLEDEADDDGDGEDAAVEKWRRLPRLLCHCSTFGLRKYLHRQQVQVADRWGPVRFRSTWWGLDRFSHRFCLTCYGQLCTDIKYKFEGKLKNTLYIHIIYYMLYLLTD